MVPSRILGSAGLLFALTLAACGRKSDAEQRRAPEQSEPAAAPAPPPPEFEAIDARSIPSRGAPQGTEGRFIARPAAVASPCGFHLVVSGEAATWTVLLVGRELAWTKEGTPLLLKLDGLTLDIGLIDAKAMGQTNGVAPEALLDLSGQWEMAWLKREAGGSVAMKENARGQAHLEPHPAWRAWSATLGSGKTSADVRATNVVAATVALDQRVLLLRALLEGEALALRALRRLVFAVDSIEHHEGALGRSAYLETLRKAAEQDPTCSAIHAAHGAQLE